VRPPSRSFHRHSVKQAVVLAVVGLMVVGFWSACGGGKNATVALTTTATTATTATTTGGGQVASGAQLFSDNCESCHGPLGAGGHVGPNLQKSPVAEHLDQVEKQVHNGGGAMPPFSGVLSDEEIGVVAHYVVEQIAPKG
jgi:mono/diheme cytochrome c family protein